MQNIQISVALVTRNRPESLSRCLTSWRSQKVQPFEIVVSDDSTPEFAPRMEDIVREFGCVYVKGPRKGLAANRNVAALGCRGSHILSADDDQTYPTDYLSGVESVLELDSRRVWIFPERPPGQPEFKVGCPAQLHRSGFGHRPADPSDCAAIADGSTAYPREIFDRGLRYDETYRFGGTHYLWGKWLVKNGWRISFSDVAYLWHHGETENRATNSDALKLQLEATTYVSFANALWLDRSPVMLFWSVFYLARRMVVRSSIKGFQIKTRIKPVSAASAIRKAFQARRLYRQNAGPDDAARASLLSRRDRSNQHILPSNRAVAGE